MQSARAPTMSAIGPSTRVATSAWLRLRVIRIPHCVLDTLLRRAAPDHANDRRRRQGDEERERTGDRRAPELTSARTEYDWLVASRREQRDREQRRREGEDPHPPAGDRGLTAARPPEPGCRDRGKHRPVDQETNEVAR